MKKKKDDWFDDHLEVIGFDDNTNKIIKDKIIDGFTDTLQCITTRDPHSSQVKNAKSIIIDLDMNYHCYSYVLTDDEFHTFAMEILDYPTSYGYGHTGNRYIIDSVVLI